MKGALFVLGGLGVALTLAAVGVSATVTAGTGSMASAALVVRHQTRGCHAWSLNGGPYAAKQLVRLGRGGWMTVTNSDLMAQELVQTSGPVVRMKLVQNSHMGGSVPMGMMGPAGPYTMAHMGAKLRVTFPKAGVYRFHLVDRGDFVEVKTVGEDLTLTLKVVVTSS